jgi:hypothetical protein
MVGITITVERDTPAGYDPYGDTAATSAATHTIDGCAVAPLTADELLARGRDATVLMLHLYLPTGADLQPTDRVVISADDPMPGRYEVEGQVRDWRSPYSGWSPGGEAVLRRAGG